jgi:hypothetical protein
VEDAVNKWPLVGRMLFHYFLHRAAPTTVCRKSFTNASEQSISFLITLSNYAHLYSRQLYSPSRALICVYTLKALMDNKIPILATFCPHTKLGRERDQLFPLRVTDDSVESRNIISGIAGEFRS